MKNTNRDNSLLPLCRQDTKKGKELRSVEAKPGTRRPPSPRRRWPTPHRRRSKKHEQGQYRKQPTRQESVSRRGRGRVGRQGRRGTPGAARPNGCE
jgi:hypothetical protein